MEKEYGIEVCMAPHPWDNPEEPHFWIIWGDRGKGKYNAGCGWAKTPELAWQNAIDHYKRFIV